MWTLRTATVGTASTSGEISALKLCLDRDVAAGVGNSFHIILTLITMIFSKNILINAINYFHAAV